MPYPKFDGGFGACCFKCRVHLSENNTSFMNGLPLTPCSVKIVGRFRELAAIEHPNLVRCLDAIRGEQDYMFIVMQHHSNNLSSLIQSQNLQVEDIPRITTQICHALLFLHKKFILHTCLSTKNVLLDSENQVRLTQYHLYSITDAGADVEFFPCDVAHSAPELLICLENLRKVASPKCDVWSLGMLILQMTLGLNINELWKKRQVVQIIQQVVAKCGVEGSALPKLIESMRVAKPDLDMNIPAVLYSLIEKCLMVSPNLRPSISNILEHEYLRDSNIPASSNEEPLRKLDVRKIRQGSVLDALRIDELYVLWKLTGTSVEIILKRKGLLKTTAPILRMATVCLHDLHMLGPGLNSIVSADLAIVPLSMQNLIQRLEALPREALTLSVQLPLEFRVYSPAGEDLSTLVKETSLEYQLRRMLLFRRLLESNGYKRDMVIKESASDIAPLYRGKVWACILEVPLNVTHTFRLIDTRTVTPTDRQMEVDIPRCHQYDELMASPAGHRRLKQVLKAWVNNHTQYVYWQGLDSLSAPFVYLNFNNPALAYGSLSAFIPKFCHDFFLKDNSAVIQEYLAVFDLLIAFHEPEIFSLMREIMFGPELYAIPWFLTMFAHVLPMPKLLHLWDNLLLGDSVFPLCMGVAILREMKDELMTFGFNECILVFSDLPDVHIQRCTDDATVLYHSTPKSITYRVHAPPCEQLLPLSEWTLADLKAATSPRISSEDMHAMIDAPDGPRVLVLDIRTAEEYYRGSVADAVHVAQVESLSRDTSAPVRHAMESGATIVVAGNTLKDESSVAASLVIQGVSRVCILDAGMQSVRDMKQLVVPPRYRHVRA